MNFFALKNYYILISFVFMVKVLFVESTEIKCIYKLAKLNEDFSSYTSSLTETGRDGKSYTYVKLLDFKLFFEIEYDIDYHRIPKKANDSYDYNTYSSEFEDYCLLKHTSYEFYQSNLPDDNVREMQERLRAECSKQKMNTHFYNYTQMNYNFLPQPNDTDLEEYVSRIDNFGSTIQDKATKEIFDYFYNIYIREPLSNQSEDNRKKYFTRLLGRRAIETEYTHVDYATRISAKGYYPLSRGLWEKEMEDLEKCQKFIDMEANLP